MSVDPGRDLLHALQQARVHVRVRLAEHELADCRRVVSEIVSVASCYLESPPARPRERFGADLTQAGMFDRTEHSVVEGGNDRVPGHMSMIDETTDAVNSAEGRR